MKLTERRMIERVARAYAQVYGARLVVRRGGESLTNAALVGYGSFGDSAAKYADDNWQKFELEAEAGIAAMRAPTMAMLTAGHTDPYDDPLTIWRAMIDEALK